MNAPSSPGNPSAAPSGPDDAAPSVEPPRRPKVVLGPVLSLEERKAERLRKERIAAGEEPELIPPTPAAAPAAPPAAAPAPKAAAPARQAAAPAPAKAAPPQPKAPPQAAPQAPAPQRLPTAPPVKLARAKARHWLVALSFLLLVLVPPAVAAWYLWERAAPRYASHVGFSVRTEEMGSALDLLGGLASFAGSSSNDTDILYRFIQSQEIVNAVDARLDLRSLWSKGDPVVDPVFTFHAPGTIEDLHDYWQRMVAVYNDTGTGLLDIEVQAFSPDDAQAIAQAIYEESQTLINRLSDIAQEDRTRHAREELDAAEVRLTDARVAMTRFRNETQIVDPVTALQGQMGLLNALESQLAQNQIDLDLLGEGDPRRAEIESRIAAIESRMAEERAKLGLGRTEQGDDVLPGASGEAFADLVGRYEQLAVEQEFAQQAYVAAMAAYDTALAEGRQQSRYLAAHVEPTLAQRADYPRRWTITLLTGLFAFLIWMLLTLVGYALRDRR